MGEGRRRPWYSSLLLTYSVLVTRKARNHIADALRWYDEESPEQIPRLQEELARTMRAIAWRPHVFRVVDGDIRRAHLAVFPYKVWFLMHEAEQVVEVFAVLHDRQDDGPFRLT